VTVIPFSPVTFIDTAPSNVPPAIASGTFASIPVDQTGKSISR
jgi:hypothetical protein